jgi:hypothetical protein
MAALSNCELKRNRWIARTTWFAGVGVFLLEMSASVNYLQAGLEKHAPSLMSFLPMTAMWTASLLGHVAQNLCSIEYAMRLLPLVVVPFALMVAGLIFERRSVIESRNAVR